MFIVFLKINGQTPIDNPYLTKYDTCPPWTNELKWHNVVNINDYAISPVDWDSSLSLAMNNLILQGGGVVYFPSGNYEFKNNVVLLNNIVLRGDNPLSKNAKSDSFAPPSRLIFPAYVPVFEGDGTPNSTAFKRISCVSNANNVGLVYLDINRGGISLTGNQNILVFGVRQNNVAVPQDDIPGNNYYMHRWQRFAYRHGRNLIVRVNRNTAVTNNRVNDFENNIYHPIPNESYDQPGYIAYCRFSGSGVACQSSCDYTSESCTDTTHVMQGERVKFSYTDHYCIDVAGTTINVDTLTVDLDQKIEINDNWAYNTMRVGIFGKGYGLVMKGNVRKDLSVKQNFLHPVGNKLNNNNAATLENRALNFSGHKVLIEDNDLEVYRHRIVFTPYYSVDGEGILTQESVDPYKWLRDIKIINNKVNSYIGLYRMRDLRDIYIAGNDLMNVSFIQVDAFTNATPYSLDDCTIENNFNVKSITVQGKIRTTNLKINNNTGDGTGKITHSCPIAEKIGNAGFFDTTTCSTSAPVPVSFYPENLSLNAPLNQSLVITFNQEIYAENLTGITITGATEGLVGGITPIVNTVAKTLEIQHNPFIVSSDQYTVNIPAGTIKNVTSNLNAAINNWTFKTVSKPFLIFRYPSINATGIGVNEVVVAEFNQEIIPVDLSLITMTNAALQTVAINVEFNSSGNYLIIRPNGALSNGQEYIVTIPANTVKNSSNAFNEVVSWSFSTAITVNINDLHVQNEVKIYPQPATDYLVVDYVKNKCFDVSLFDLKGVEIYKRKGIDGLLLIPMQHLNSGVYILNVLGDDQLVRKKIIKH
jgi:hypothetical protein